MNDFDDFLNHLIDSECEELAPLGGGERKLAAFQIRLNNAENKRDSPVPDHTCNNDEQTYSNKIGNYSKGLPHDQSGLVKTSAYNAIINALKSGKPDSFETIPLGGDLKLANPQAAYAFDLLGYDSHHFPIPNPPSIDSSWHASEMAELYWRALTRDIPFTEYHKNGLIIEATRDLSRFSNFKGPKVRGKVTTRTLFRGDSLEELTGPIISQFMWQDIPYGNNILRQKYRTTISCEDYMTDYDEWLKVQNGRKPSEQNIYDPQRRYVRNARDLGEWVHRDFTFQAFLNACLILLSYGSEAINPTNPYLNSQSQVGFITFGAAHVLDMVTKSARNALEAAWFQKWLVHRRVRPEEFGGVVHQYLSGNLYAPIHQELVESRVLNYIEERYGTYLLPMAFAEGCPTHPAYPAGHACIAGAGITMLKAFFDEDFTIPEPLVASSDGLSLNPYKGEPLTVGGELNKLASNIALGRDAAGVHWRSDSIEGIKLGEAVAIGILKDYKDTFNEHFTRFKFTKYDGQTITI
ncbi:vanadium-dependent haloperoxidase [Alkalibacillus aidingensis]|uniref:vanadium-dependent haloperoxidase n=1 Tax=Alkalibacillus aidingensis TaxID=2747607 RepID=UPI001CB6BD33|nr:vanadium-dependent haloperoxidase [Alkalibacillus aidingensis]